MRARSVILGGDGRTQTANPVEGVSPIMRVVRDGAGRINVVRERSDEQRVLVDPATGTERTVSAADVVPVVDEPELELVASALPDPTDSPLASIGDARARGILGVLEAAGPLPATMLLAFESLCESDLHGTVGELRAAGLVAETTVDGHSGYRMTETAARTLADLRD